MDVDGINSDNISEQKNGTSINEQKNDIKNNEYKSLKIKWNKKNYTVFFNDNTNIDDIKEQLIDLTNVIKKNQKIIGYKNKLNTVNDSTLIINLKLNKKKYLTMIGTPSNDMFNDSDIYSIDIPYILDDFDHKYSSNIDDINKRIKNNIKKLNYIKENIIINKIVEPRSNKKLLVLDIDYTLFDIGSKNLSLNWNDLKRPSTDYLLNECYKYYDIVIWSQTSWKWIEIKLTEMNMLMNNNYKITFVLDKKSMFTIISNFKNKKKKHYVKPLQFIWDNKMFNKYYNKNNTIHIDDLSRNFALNPKQGLTIKPYKNAYKNKNNDKELLYLTKYLINIAKLNDFKGINHDKWKQYLTTKGINCD